MDYKLHAESGCQLLARLAPRPPLNGLADHIFSLIPNESPTIEVKGHSGSGKSMLLMKWAAKAVLSKPFGGLGAGVLLFDTDMRFSISTFCSLLETNLLQYSEKISGSVKEKEVLKALELLTVITVHDGIQLRASILTLDKLLLDSPCISLVLLDSLPAFYWSDRLSQGECHKDTYQQKFLNLIHHKTHQHKITVAFTKRDNFQSQSGSSASVSPGVNILIELQAFEDDKFTAHVISLNRQRIFSYIITKNGLIWTS